MFDRAPAVRGKLADLEISLRDTRYESALTVDDTGTPARRDITRIEEMEEVLVASTWV
jgi:hypothetical protein